MSVHCRIDEMQRVGKKRLAKERLPARARISKNDERSPQLHPARDKQMETQFHKPNFSSLHPRYILSKIRIAPNNESPWNYLKGILDLCNEPPTSFPQIEELCLSFNQETHPVPFALAFLLDLEEARGRAGEAQKVNGARRFLWCFVEFGVVWDAYSSRTRANPKKPTDMRSTRKNRPNPKTILAIPLHNRCCCYTCKISLFSANPVCALHVAMLCM